MAGTNVKARDQRVDATERVAGGFGASAAVQGPDALLRRSVLAALLWEDVAYQSGQGVADEIAALVPQVEAQRVAALAIEARTQQRLRHVPLLLARECARLASHKHVVASLLPQIIRRPDEITEFVSLYWQPTRQPLSAQVKRGLAMAFRRFNAYQLAKYDQREKQVTLRDVLFLIHAKPADEAQADTWKQLVAGSLSAPDTWEVALSSGADKRATWERLISDGQLGALAFLRNLRNMEQAKVDPAVIRAGFGRLKSEMLLPFNFFAAAKVAPQWLPEIEDAMLRCLSASPRLAGTTHLILDVSGSMRQPLSAKSRLDRLDATGALAVLAREMCEHVTVWATAGSDCARTHATAMVPTYRGFALADAVKTASASLGGGGIFTRQALDFVREHCSTLGERTIVISDSQDCDTPRSGLPRPFSPRNYIVDVSSHTRGIAYDRVWTAEISGWSEHFLTYIHALETSSLQN